MKRRPRSTNEPVEYSGPDAAIRPWYYRYGYHVGVWSGAAVGLIWYAIFQDLIGLVVGVVLGKIAGMILGRMGRTQ